MLRRCQLRAVCSRCHRLEFHRGHGSKRGGKVTLYKQISTKYEDQSLSKISELIEQIISTQLEKERTVELRLADKDGNYKNILGTDDKSRY